MKAKRQQTPAKKNPARNRHRNGILAILLVERGITPANQNDIRSPQVYHLACEKERFGESSFRLQTLRCSKRLTEKSKKYTFSKTCNSAANVSNFSI